MVSVDTIDNAALSQKAYHVPFPLLSDSNLKVHEAYHVLNAVSDELANKLKAKHFDLERWSGKKHHKLAIPSMFLIGRDGVVRFAHAARDHKTRPKLDALLPALKKALAAAPSAAKP